MNDKKDILLLMVHGCMEFTWRYAWAGFTMFAMVGRPVPFFETFAVFAFAAIVTRISQGRGWRILYILVLQAMSLVFTAGVIVHAFYFRSFSFWSQGWIREFFNSSRTPMEGIMLFVFGLWFLLFWTGGVNLMRKPPHYYAVCARFDRGMAALFILYLLQWLLLERGGIQMVDPFSRALIFPYFLFSIFAIGLARNRDNERREYLDGRSGVGIIFTVLASIMLIGTFLFLFLLPFITAAAETGYTILKDVASPLGPLVVRIILFLFTGRKAPSYVSASPETSGNSQPSPVSTSESSWWEEVIEEVLGWGAIGVLGGALIVLVVICVWLLVRWLLSQTDLSEPEKRDAFFLSRLIKRIWDFLIHLRNSFHEGRKRPRQASLLFGQLLVWGRRSGVSRLQSETPSEYGERLKRMFPVLEEEIRFIIDLYHTEIFGEKNISERQGNIMAVRRRLRSPVYWPSRLRSWFFRPEATTGPE